MSRLGTETAFEVLAAAKAREAVGHRVVHLEIGEPDFDTPENIVDAAVRALQGGWHHYTPAVGVLELREAIADEVGRTRGISVHPDEVVVTPGGKPIIFFSLLSLAGDGDEVIYPNPGFPIYESMIAFVGARPVPVALREELDFRLDVTELIEKISDNTRLIILNSPNNPTGSVLTRQDIEKLAEATRDLDLFILSDEIYSRILYEGEHISIASFPGMKDKTIILDGFSKTYAMTGWRLGYGVMTASLAQQLGKLMINSNSCTAAFTQMAGIEALRGDQSSPEEMVNVFHHRRDRVVELLNGIDGVTCRSPKGAFYAFPNVKAFGRPALELQRQLLETADVAVLSGTAFGQYGEGYLRLSYANSLEQLEDGIERIAEVLSRLSGP
ncbi:MAG TPA: pyridoxal phosphate-dependent aminotransferase [Acidobacteriota bacterium]|nr:pyridoxal phosphate-dependent aminotransferase [Acidobacteriota bacterium]